MCIRECFPERNPRFGHRFEYVNTAHTQNECSIRLLDTQCIGSVLQMSLESRYEMKERILVSCYVFVGIFLNDVPP